MQDRNECYTLDEVANLLKTTRQNILNWRKKGIIEAVEIGGRVLIRRTEVERLLNENTK